jgi:hypothetical protein
MTIFTTSTPSSSIHPTLKMTARINGRSVTFSCVAQSCVSLIRQEVALHFGTLRGLPVTVGTPHGLFTCLLDFIISDEICSDVGLGCDWFAFWKEYLHSEGLQVTTEMGDVLPMPVPSVFSFVI